MPTKRLPLVLAMLSLFLLMAAVVAQAQPCVVTASVPANRAQGVDPKLAYIEVSFNQDMTPGRWSWVTNPKLGAFPVVAGKPVFVDGRTCRLPVKLAPGVTYAVGINTEGYGNFRALAAPGTPCAPYQIIFTTGN
ncbi:MAG: Ig-like domain-containing protein [Proteobacteria bacterium]|nr:Ig-like domain-containing protein [Pseudomonadota bacterium]MBU4573644.1 Ig-like domain-containing protein [Pseudomonadota bacterium]MBU4599646.1 Ig-like domain-containing protein [Pseudomonadota bacterium]MBV1716142.1 Ig-like domain-containing protein [Desulfarculus sp.]MBV1753182.1 Ig-like domain-containing protein [Desulfarculus sp.]